LRPAALRAAAERPLVDGGLRVGTLFGAVPGRCDRRRCALRPNGRWSMVAF